MATSYEAWAKFDVDAELERVDLQAQREEQHREVQKQRRAKQSVEDAVSTSAEQSAEVLAAHAAVAALKAKARAKKKQSAGVAAANGGDSAGDGDANGDLLSEHAAASSNQTGADKQEESAAERLQRQSELFKKKHELIKQIMENRRKGETILAQEGEEKRRSVDPDTSRERRALCLFENALTFAQELEKIVPDLILAEREQSVLRDANEAHAGVESVVHGASATETKPNNSHHHHHNDHHEGHSCGGDASQCAHAHGTQGDTKSKTDKDVLPKVNDLEAILRMFFKDIHMGIGACHLQGNRLAAASDAFKDVLLRDDAHVAAWLERGSAFERMGANLLAMLHFSRATALDPSDKDAKESLGRVKETLFSGLDDIIGADATKRKVESLTHQSSLPAILNSIYLVFQEANVLMIEGFFQYAIPKYQIVLGCIDFLLDEKPELFGADEEQSGLAVEIQASLNQLRTSCRLNIAGGYHEMQKNQLKAVEYCENVLASDAADRSVQAACHFRIGQLFRSAHGYERAMDHLELSRKLLVAVHPAPEAQKQHQHEQRIETLKKIDKEIDRCGFERSQHDLTREKRVESQEIDTGGGERRRRRWLLVISSAFAAASAAGPTVALSPTARPAGGGIASAAVPAVWRGGASAQVVQHGSSRRPPLSATGTRFGALDSRDSGQLLRAASRVEELALVRDQVIDLGRGLAHARTDVQVLAELVLLKLDAVVVGCQRAEELSAHGVLVVFENLD